MAAKGAIKAVIAAQFDGTGLLKAQKQIGGFAKSLKGTLGALGIATSFTALVQQLDQAGRAAAADARSQALLANAMRNTIGATQGQIIETEKSIQKFSSLYGIMDDNIRPSMAQFVRVTGDATKATELTNLALNVSAGTGRDLSAVTIALGKAYQGNTASLGKLGLNVKGLKDPMGALAQQFAGAAEAAANVDPYQRIQVAMDNTQETIGAALLPAMNRLADLLNSSVWTDGVDTVASGFNDLLSGLLVVTDGITNLVTDINTAMSNLGTGIDLGGFFDFIARITPGLNLLRNLIGMGKEANAKSNLPDETSRLIRQRLERLGAFTADKQYDSSGASAKAAAAAAALKKQQEALAAANKKVIDTFNAQVDAYWKAVDAAKAFLTQTREVTAGLVKLFDVVPSMGEFETAVVDGFQNIYDTIKSAVTDNLILKDAGLALTKFADTSIAAMRSIAQQRDVLAKKIDVARTITSGVLGLANITSMLETVTQSVTTSVRTMANGIETIITRTTDVTTSGGLVDNFQKLVDKTKKFAQNLIDLKKLGLNKNLFAQLVNAGADAGGATADALVQGGSDTIVALNDLYRQLDVTAGEIAQNTTDVMYEVGQQIISNGFIDGLVSQADALTQAAQSLAQSFADAFNKQMAGALQANLPALPKVPSVAMSSAGIGGGLAAQLASMGFFSSGVATSNGLNQINAPASVINLYLQAQGTGVTGTQLAQQMIAEIKKYERANGAVWKAAQ